MKKCPYVTSYTRCDFKDVLQHTHCFKEELSHPDYCLKSLHMQAGPPQNALIISLGKQGIFLHSDWKAQTVVTRYLIKTVTCKQRESAAYCETKGLCF